MRQTFYLEFPPFDKDLINILSSGEYGSQELPANYGYEEVNVPGDFESVEALYEWQSQENEQRRNWR